MFLPQRRTTPLRWAVVCAEQERENTQLVENSQNVCWCYAEKSRRRVFLYFPTDAMLLPSSSSLLSLSSATKRNRILSVGQILSIKTVGVVVRVCMQCMLRLQPSRAPPPGCDVRVWVCESEWIGWVSVTPLVLWMACEWNNFTSTGAARVPFVLSGIEGVYRNFSDTWIAFTKTGHGCQ